MNNLVKRVQDTYLKSPISFQIIGITTLFLVIVFPIYGIYNEIKPSDTEYSEDRGSDHEDCNVQGIELRGELFTYVPRDDEGVKEYGLEDSSESEDVMYYLKNAENEDDIKGVLIEVDSYGGSPAAAEEISNTIKSMNKPVVVFIREAGLSASYYAISPADYIFALKNSSIGSIGVTQSYLDNISKNQKEGNSFVQLSVGKFKDSGNPDKSLNQEERALFMRDLNIIHENFIQAISENRNIQIDKIRDIADGSSVLGEKAKELGLIDDIGGYVESQKYIENLIDEEVSVCW